MLPVLVTVALGLVAIPFTITELGLTLKVILLVATLLSLGGVMYFFLRSIHFKQDSLWELYTFICFDDIREKVDKLQYGELMHLQEVIANIHRSERLRKKSYDKLVNKAKSIIDPERLSLE